MDINDTFTGWQGMIMVIAVIKQLVSNIMQYNIKQLVINIIINGDTSSFSIIRSKQPSPRTTSRFMMFHDPRDKSNELWAVISVGDTCHGNPCYTHVPIIYCFVLRMCLLPFMQL